MQIVHKSYNNLAGNLTFSNILFEPSTSAYLKQRFGCISGSQHILSVSIELRLFIQTHISPIYDNSFIVDTGTIRQAKSLLRNTNNFNIASLFIS